jgi:hypothetical protein
LLPAVLIPLNIRVRETGQICLTSTQPIVLLFFLIFTSIVIPPPFRQTPNAALL